MRCSTGEAAVCAIIQLLFVLAVDAVAPVVFEPSQNWDGDDGQWSSFSVRLGNPEQVVRLLPSTQGYNTIAVLPKGCDNTTDYTDCVSSRGGIFDPSGSSTWQDVGQFGAGMQANLGYGSVNVDFGLDKVGLGIISNENLTFAGQVIGGISQTDFYVGTFGLGTQPTNFTVFTDPHTSFFTSLWGNGLIPSYTWSYTAGAKYKSTGILGSLVFGGYDSSRIAPSTGITMAMATDVSRDLVVGLQSITVAYSGGSKSLLPSGGIFTFVDSTLPYIWLPIDACKAFETSLGLVWNSTLELYLVDDTLHQKLQSLNPQFTFTIGPTKTGGESIDITLPYSSFDLTAKYPILNNSIGYFPIKRAANDTQYTLGRTFLQEAMLTVDYERNNFSITPCVWDSTLKEKVVTILSVAGAANATSSAPSTASPSGAAGKNTAKKSSISTGAIAGIVILAVAAIILGAVILWLRKTKKWPFARAKALEMDGTESSMEGGHADGLEAPAYLAMEPKPGTVEAMGSDSAMAEMGDVHPVAGYYAKAGRHEMSDSTPVGSELASPGNEVHELYDSSVFHEMHSTTSSQARGSPSGRATGNASQPFSWLETPVSTVSGPTLRGCEGDFPDSNDSYLSGRTTSYRPINNNAEISREDQHPYDYKYHPGPAI